MDRREFARDMVGGAIAGSIALGSNVAGAATQDPATPSVEDQLIAILRRQLGDRLSDEQWKQIQGKVNGQLAAAKALREFKLLNSDEPATVFVVYNPS
jgi:hypothetical protein